MTDTRSKLLKIIEDFDTAMLITADEESAPHARPMSIASVERGGEFWFFSSRDAVPVTEVRRDVRCTVTMQGKRQFVALRGAAEVIEDVGKIRQLWSEKFRPWFPAGPASPRIALIRFVPVEGEYWDVSGIEALRYAVLAGKAFLKGERIEEESDRRHASISM